MLREVCGSYAGAVAYHLWTNEPTDHLAARLAEHAGCEYYTVDGTVYGPFNSPQHKEKTIAVVPWPSNVRGMDWTQPAMAGPPEERTRIGYRRWADTSVDTEDEDYGYPCGEDYYILPDGSAEIVRWSKYIRDRWDGETATEVLPPGTWEVEYPTSTFGSRGGCCIRSIRRVTQCTRSY